MKNTLTSKELLTKYYDFLIELYTISRNQSFVFSEMVTKHKISKSIQTILSKNGFVEKDGKLWKWVGKKPTKIIVEDILKMLKEYSSISNKAYNSKVINVKSIKHSNTIKQTLDSIDEIVPVMIKEDIEINPLVEQYNKLENDLKEMSDNYNEYISKSIKTIDDLKLELTQSETKTISHKIAHDMLMSENVNLKNDKNLLNNAINNLDLKYKESDKYNSDVKNVIKSSKLFKFISYFDNKLKFLLIDLVN